MANNKEPKELTKQNGSIIDLIKNNLIKTGIIGVATFGIALVTGIIAVDSRYAHAADVGKKMDSLGDQLEVNRLTAEVSVLTMRKSSLEDKVYDSAVRGQLSKNPNSPEGMIQERYRNELIEINKQISDKNKLIDRIRTRTMQQR